MKSRRPNQGQESPALKISQALKSPPLKSQALKSQALKKPKVDEIKSTNSTFAKDLLKGNLSGPNIISRNISK